MLARHVSDLTTGPSSEAFLQAGCADLVCDNTCRVVRTVVIHTKSAHTACKNALEDGPVRSETCRANICDE